MSDGFRKIDGHEIAFQLAFSECMEMQRDWERAGRPGLNPSLAGLLEERAPYTAKVPARLGFTQRMMEESAVDRIARLEVEGHRS